MGEEAQAPGSVQALIAALFRFETMPPIERAAAAPALIDQARATLASARAGAIAEAEAGGMRRADIARKLGIARQQVTKITGAKVREGGE